MAVPTMGVTELVLEARDLDASERFYGQVLGLPVVGRWEGEAFRGREEAPDTRRGDAGLSPPARRTRSVPR